jgi:acyl-CoA synthetase (AMP-forming)/AMP-acid ligase II
MRLWDALTARDGKGVLRTWSDSGFVETPWREAAAEAAGIASVLRRAGVTPGRAVAAVLTNTADVVPALLGVWLAGGVVASLPVPAQGTDHSRYAERITALADRADAPLILLDGRIAGMFPASPRILTFESLRGAPGRLTEDSLPGEDEPAFIQFSSGSTSEPKGCVLTPRAIARQLEMILDLSGGVAGREVVSCWLPLSHDMGMFGCLLYSWAHDFDLVLSSPERFTVSPRSWFRDMAEHGATMTAGTNTALHIAARVQRTAPLPAPLKLRACIVGAERVDVRTLEQVARVFAPHGLSRAALMPAYGLAEATLAVTSTPLDRGFAVATVDGIGLADGRIAEADPADPAAVPLVSAGLPCRGAAVRPGGPGQLSEIVVSSPSLASGYLGDAERTAAVFRPEGLHTGDLGFVRDGELYVAGRADDMLSSGGRNVYAREIEGGIDSHEAVRKGCVVLIDVPVSGRGKVVLLAELRRRDADYQRFAEHAARVAMARAGVGIDECIFLPRETLPKTPSGKIQRFRCRQLVTADALQPVARVVLGD